MSEAIGQIARALESEPAKEENGRLTYCWVCYLQSSGDTKLALEKLAEANRVNTMWGVFANNDEDWKSIWKSQEFKKAVQT